MSEKLPIDENARTRVLYTLNRMVSFSEQITELLFLQECNRLALKLNLIYKTDQKQMLKLITEKRNKLST